jgi:hypothetical protein
VSTSPGADGGVVGLVASAEVVAGGDVAPVTGCSSGAAVSAALSARGVVWTRGATALVAACTRGARGSAARPAVSSTGATVPDAVATTGAVVSVTVRTTGAVASAVVRTTGADACSTVVTAGAAAVAATSTSGVIVGVDSSVAVACGEVLAVVRVETVCVTGGATEPTVDVTPERRPVDVASPEESPTGRPTARAAGENAAAATAAANTASASFIRLRPYAPSWELGNG